MSKNGESYDIISTTDEEIKNISERKKKIRENHSHKTLKTEELVQRRKQNHTHRSEEESGTRLKRTMRRLVLGLRRGF